MNIYIKIISSILVRITIKAIIYLEVFEATPISAQGLFLAVLRVAPADIKGQIHRFWGDHIQYQELNHGWPHAKQVMNMNTVLLKDVNLGSAQQILFSSFLYLSSLLTGAQFGLGRQCPRLKGYSGGQEHSSVVKHRALG